MTNEEDQQDNSVVILSDDEDEERDVINENGKRPFCGQDDMDDEEEEMGSSEEEDYEFSDEEYSNEIHKNQTLPEDHESAILGERDQLNPLQELDTLLQEFKQLNHMGMIKDDIETNFSCGFPLKDNAPDIAINIDGILGPITFPLISKDAKRITEAPLFELPTAKIVLNLSFQEYLFETVHPEVMSYLGVDQSIASHTRLQANKFYISQQGHEDDIVLNESIGEKGCYGTVMLILPTDYEGGEIMTNYKENELVYQPETDNPCECYCIAWYNDVEHKILPVVNGYQSFISLSLIYHGPEESITIAMLQQRRVASENGILVDPALSQPILTKATDYFKSKLSDAEWPYFYMLNYSYSSRSLSFNDLRRSDKLLAKTLIQVAEQSGFDLFIGAVEREVEAKVKEEDITNASMDEEGIYLTESTIYEEYILTSLTNKEGRNLLVNPVGIDCKQHQPLIQGVNWYARCKPETEDYNGEATVKYWYSDNTALVFLPKKAFDKFIQLSKESAY